MQHNKKNHRVELLRTNRAKIGGVEFVAMFPKAGRAELADAAAVVRAEGLEMPNETHVALINKLKGDKLLRFERSIESAKWFWGDSSKPGQPFNVYNFYASGGWQYSRVMDRKSGAIVIVGVKPRK